MTLNIRNFPVVTNIETLLKSLPEDHPVRKEWGELLNFITGLHRSQQGALSVSARRNIAYGIYRNIVEEPGFEWSATDFDYEDEHHARVTELMKTLRSNENGSTK